LNLMGFERTAALKGGLDAWAADGNPVAAGQESR
jgi:3-mercaptopyruvate sulfurtransferase SseA